MHEKDYKNLLIWKKGMELVKAVYAFTATLPVNEKFGLTSQLNRCAVSVISNIAEGKGRGTKKDFRRFLITSQGSSYELETQLLITKELEIGETKLRDKAKGLVIEEMKMLSSFINSISN